MDSVSSITTSTFKELLEDYCDIIFSIMGYEFELYLNDYNILTRDDNIVERSKSVNCILEEFVIAKLHSFTEHKKNSKFIVYPAESTHLSYDCYAEYNGVRYLITINSNKETDFLSKKTVYKEFNSCIDKGSKISILIQITYSFVNSKSKRKIKITKFCIELTEDRGHV